MAPLVQVQEKEGEERDERAATNSIVLIVARALSTHPWQAADKLRTDGREHQSRGRSRICASPFGRQTSISDMGRDAKFFFFGVPAEELRKIVWGSC
jgi:hypothetical protein